MSELSKILNEIGVSILLQHSRSLLVLIDAQGTILESNEQFGNPHSSLQITGLFTDLLAETNRMKFTRLLHESLQDQIDKQAVFHFAGSEAELRARRTIAGSSRWRVIGQFYMPI